MAPGPPLSSTHKLELPPRNMEAGRCDLLEETVSTFNKRHPIFHLGRLSVYLHKPAALKHHHREQEVELRLSRAYRGVQGKLVGLPAKPSED